MMEVQKIAITKALRTLEAMKEHVQFAAEFNGEVFGNRKLAEAKAYKRAPRYPYGETRKHYIPYFEGVKIGDVIEVPFGPFDPGVLSANISAACVHMFGKGNSTVHQNKKTGNVEVLVTGMPDDGKVGQIEMFDEADAA